MNETVKGWIDHAWSVLESIPGASEAVAQERSRWREFRDLETTEFVVFGAYDAGKSSLLKRILVDQDAQVPEWLTVSGRRETFEAKRVLAKSVGFVDTPGLGSGNNDHDDLTLDAMRLADAYLWVLPPQLVTSGKERLLEILFAQGGIGNVTIAVIARMDEAGVDPGDNETGFSDLCQRKKDELLSISQEARATKELHSIHCVVADPYQMVGNMPQPDRSIYDVGRSWDGIAELGEAVIALGGNLQDLRQQAGVRFVRLVVEDVRDELRLLSEDLALSKEGMDNEVDRYAIYERRLDALQHQACAELHRRIEDVLLSVSRTGVNKVSDSIEHLESTLAKIVDEWGEGTFADYRRLVAEIEMEARERLAGPSMNGFRRLARETEEREAKESELKVDPVKTGKKALAFGPALRKAFKSYAESELGMSLKEAADRLQKLESSGETIEAFTKLKGRKAPFRGAEHAKKASQYVKWANVLDAVGPLLEQIGSVLFDVATDVMSAKQAEERAQQRLELGRQLRVEAENLQNQVSADFDSTCDGVREWLSRRLMAIEDARGSLSDQIESLEGAAASLDEIVRATPST